MKVDLIGVTKPTGKQGEGDDLLFVDFHKIDNILTDSKDKNIVIDSLKRLSQNFARICYSQYGWEDLAKEEFNRNLIDGRVLTSKHHSVFEHVWFNLYLDGIPKMGAMVLNNEKQYVTSEKSARYTKMKNLEPKQKEIYDKWMEQLVPVIDSVYPKLKDKDARLANMQKLAQENARYMTSVFTPTKMAYTANLRQLNFLIDQFENGGLPYTSKEFNERLAPVLVEFADKLKPFKIKGLEHKASKNISLFENEKVDEHFGSVYSTSYDMSFAGLAQAQRHRTLDYEIYNDISLGAKEGVFVPDVVRYAGLEDEWARDMNQVAQYDFPQGQLVKVNEMGTLKNYKLKTDERICGHAQHEIMRNTVATAEKYSKFQDKFGAFYNKPKCAESASNCNGACIWGKNNAVSRKV